MVEAKKNSSPRTIVLYDETPTPAPIRSYPKPNYTPLKEIFKKLDGKAIKTLIDTIRDRRFYERQDGVAQDVPRKHCSVIYEISTRVSNINKKLGDMELGFDFEDTLKEPRLIMKVRKADYGSNKYRKKLVRCIDTTTYMIEQEGKWLDEVQDALVDALKTKSKRLKRGMGKQGGRIALYTLPETILFFNPVTLPVGISLLLSATAAAANDVRGVYKKYSEREKVQRATSMVKRMKLTDLSSLLIDVGCYSKWKLDKEMDRILEYEEEMTKTLVKELSANKVKDVYNKIPLPPAVDNFVRKMYRNYKWKKTERKLTRQLNKKYKELKKTVGKMKTGEIESNYAYIREELDIAKGVYSKLEYMKSRRKG